MAKIDLPRGWVHQAYRFEVDRPVRHPTIASHEGAKRFAWNWGLGLVEEHLRARAAYRVLALRSGASIPEADEWAKLMVLVPWKLAQLRKIWNDVRVPVETGHPIRSKPATQSGRNRPPNPVETGHLFRLIPATPAG